MPDTLTGFRACADLAPAFFSFLSLSARGTSQDSVCAAAHSLSRFWAGFHRGVWVGRDF